MAKVRRKDALEFHTQGRPGKVQVVPTKPLTTQRDLALARESSALAAASLVSVDAAVSAAARGRKAIASITRIPT